MGKICFCTICQRAKKKQRMELAAGIRRTVDVGVARRALEERLEISGLTLHQLANRSAGISHSNLKAILASPDGHHRVQIRTLEKIRRLAADPGYVSRLGSEIRVQALRAEGWSEKTLRFQYGITVSVVKRPTIQVTTARRVIELIETLGEGPDKRAQTLALNRGYLPRSAYDQDCLVDPLWDGKDGLLNQGVNVLEQRRYERTEFVRLVRMGIHPLNAYKQVGLQRGRDWIKLILREEGLHEAILALELAA